MQNMIRWGNARANKYWENKLADGHVPNEAKIENFIRTKYDSKRWAMDGPIPDPSTLDDGTEVDDDVPLNVVREKAIERSGSLRNGNQTVGVPPPRARPQDVDLFGDPSEPAPVRPSTTEPAAPRGTISKAPAAPPKQTRPGESLLGLDFFGGSNAQPARPSSTGPNTSGAPGRADLKSSILSLYASKPAAPPQQQQQQAAPQSNMDAFAGMSSAPPIPPQATTQQSSFGGMSDAFGGLSFTSSKPQPAQPKAAPVTATAPSATHTRQVSNGLLSGGSFFDPKPAAPVMQTSVPAQRPMATTRLESFGDSFGDFSAAPPNTTTAAPPPATSSMGDLFSMTSAAPKPAAAPAPIQTKQPPPINYSAFNLSQAPTSPIKPAAPAISNFTNMSSSDAWGSNDAWATPDPAPQPTAAPPMQTQPASSFTSTARPAAPIAQTPFDSGWGDAPVNSAGGFSVQQDEEFGDWGHASPVATSATSARAPAAAAPSAPKQSGGGFTNSDDLFGNVWG